MDDLAKLPWKEVQDLETFRSPGWTKRILEEMRVDGPGERQKRLAVLLKEHAQAPVRRLQELAKDLKSQLVGKDDIIDLALVSAIAHQPMLLVGPPGTAKSRIILKLCEGLGIGRTTTEKGGHAVFQYLLHGFTEPDEILGPVDLAALRAEQAAFRRIRKGSIIDAEVVFLDEVFRANSAILNALLTIMNERHVFEAGEIHRARVRLIYGASNTTPPPRLMEELRAFYERFVIRVESQPLPMVHLSAAQDEQREELLRRGWTAEVRDLRAGDLEHRKVATPVSCLNDILFLNRAAAELWGGEDIGELAGFLREYHRLVKDLSGGEDPPCSIDDRKLIRLFSVVRAHALYHRNSRPDLEDLEILKHTWNDLDRKPLAEDAVMSFLRGDRGR